jgi:hypothetical protein
MFLSLNNTINNFPENLQIDMSIYTDRINSNELGFTINMKVYDKNLNQNEGFDITYIGTYLLNTEKLFVSQKGYFDNKDQFYLNGKILVPNLFTEFILPHLL